MQNMCMYVHIRKPDNAPPVSDGFPMVDDVEYIYIV